mgnify:CR=1 FL=1
MACFVGYEVYTKQNLTKYSLKYFMEMDIELLLLYALKDKNSPVPLYEKNKRLERIWS